MNTASIDLRRTEGYLVADESGQVVGRVECPMYGRRPDVPDALSVKTRRFSRHRYLVPAATIAEIDPRRGTVSLNVGRHAIQAFI